MRLDLDGRQVVLTVGFTVCAVLVAVSVIALAVGSDGGFDAIDTNNTAPVIDANLDGAPTFTVGQAVTPFTVRATDADGDPVTFTATNLPIGITIDATTGTISGAASAPCACTASVVADDGRGGRDAVVLVWTVAGSETEAGDEGQPSVLQIDEELAVAATNQPDTAGVTTTTETTATTVPASPTATSARSANTATTATGTTATETTASETTSGGGGTSNAPSSTTATTATSTTSVATTTSTMVTTTTTDQPEPDDSEAFQGVRDFDSFFEGRKRYDAWTAGDIAFYAPQGQIPSAAAEQWLDWYVRVDGLYRTVSGRSDFDSVYRRSTPDLGTKKVLAIVETCGAGCGSKQQAEADPGYIDSMVNAPDDFAQHWIFFYEMGRGGSPEPWYGKATWPSNTVIIPHLMAGLAFYELGGEAGLRQGIPGDLLGELERWEAADIEYVDEFAIADQQSSGNYTSHHLMPAMLWRIRMETDLATVGRITANMATKPPSTSAAQAMCDFRSAVNDATGGRFDDRMIGPWGLPDQC